MQAEQSSTRGEFLQVPASPARDFSSPSLAASAAAAEDKDEKPKKETRRPRGGRRLAGRGPDARARRAQARDARLRRGLRRLDAKQDFPPEPIAEPHDHPQLRRGLSRELEENFLFPASKGEQLVDLVDVLRASAPGGPARHRHHDPIREGATRCRTPTTAGAGRLDAAVHPHVQRRTRPGRTRSCFPRSAGSSPATSTTRSARSSRRRSTSCFGEDGFEKMVDRVAGIEKTLGIYELAQFTPKV